MKVKFELPGAFVLAGLLVACAPSPGDEDSAVTRGGADSATLSVIPGEVVGCGLDSRITSNVSWRVNDNHAARVKVVVADPGRKASKLFAQGGPEGSAKTEEWVQSGTRFTLLDADTDAELASYTVEGPDCGTSL